ncbi:MAG: type II secretion system F family protein [candidate division Zixibacteria bacterium]|nr:type II secretion system F family protein [candidate division Zixibacteria bacterium]
MPTFEYKGKSASGGQVTGSYKAKNKAELEKVLRQNKIFVNSISRKPTNINIKIGTGIKKIEISRFTRQFATMIGAGLPMVQCLEILSQQMDSAEFRKIISEIKESVQSGTTLSEALSKHKKIFDDLFVNMVEAGETGGALDVILIRLANYREKADALARKVKGALVYPIVVFVVAIGVTLAMLKFVVPTFAKMFTNLGGSLPEPTRIVMGVSNFVNDYFLLMIISLITFVVGFRFALRDKRFRLYWDAFKLKLPGFGNLIRKSAVARFTRTLGTLLSSGVSILEALEITAKTAGNTVIQNAVRKSMLSIAEGETITQPLKESKVFPPMVIQMISVGEKTGGLDEMLGKIADFYDEEVEAAVASLTSLIEPIVIVFIGVVIGGIMIAMYMPMFDIIGQIR